MDFMTLAKSRYSVRKFKPDAIEAGKVAAILEAGKVAPTAVNYQPQRLLVVQSEEGREKLKKVTPCHFDCPLAILVCYEENTAWHRPYDNKCSGDIDAAIVTTHLMLEAKALGVGSTWVMKFDPDAARQEFHIPEGWEPTAILVMGYPADDAEPSPRHETYVDESTLVYYESFEK